MELTERAEGGRFKPNSITKSLNDLINQKTALETADCANERGCQKIAKGYANTGRVGSSEGGFFWRGHLTTRGGLNPASRLVD